MRTVGWLTVMIVAMPGKADAQTSIEFGPRIGYYRPAGSYEAASVYSTALPRSPKDLRGTAWGGEARAWFGNRVGADVGVSFAGSTLPSIATPNGPSPTTPATVTTFTVQGLFSLAGAPTRHQVWLSAGAGVIHHGGKAYDRHGGLTDIGPLLGAGARARITQRFHATFGLAVLTYQFDLPMPPELSGNPGSLQRGRQVDMLMHMGITWMLGGR